MARSIPSHGAVKQGRASASSSSSAAPAFSSPAAQASTMYGGSGSRSPSAASTSPAASVSPVSSSRSAADRTRAAAVRCSRPCSRVRVSRDPAALTIVCPFGVKGRSEPTARNPFRPSGWTMTCSSGVESARLAGDWARRNRASSGSSDRAARSTRSLHRPSALPAAGAEASAARRTAPAWSNRITQPSTSLASRSTTAAVPSRCRAARVSRPCAAKARLSSSYCSAASSSLTALPIAMNGVSRGTSTRGSPAASAASMNSRGTRSWVRPTPNPNPATPRATSRSMYGPASAPDRRIPVVRTSSPPSRKGVGSSSSLTATQRTGRSRCRRPARTVRWSGAIATTRRSVGATSLPRLSFATLAKCPSSLCHDDTSAREMPGHSVVA